MFDNTKFKKTSTQISRVHAPSSCSAALNSSDTLDSKTKTIQDQTTQQNFRKQLCSLATLMHLKGKMLLSRSKEPDKVNKVATLFCKKKENSRFLEIGHLEAVAHSAWVFLRENKKLHSSTFEVLDWKVSFQNFTKSLHFQKHHFSDVAQNSWKELERSPHKTKQKK